MGVVAYSKGDTDFRAQLTNVKKLKPEGVYVPGYYQDVWRRQQEEHALEGEAEELR